MSEATRTSFGCQYLLYSAVPKCSLLSFYSVGMVIAQRLGTVRKRYKKIIQSRGANHIMFTKYIKGLNKQDCPVVLSITDTTQVETIIQRNQVPDADAREQKDDIYIRAREIYFRARRHRPVRAASIF